MPPTQSLNDSAIHSVDQLRLECKTLARNNDKLVNVIAQNNVNRQTIEDLEKRLAYAKRTSEDKLVDFDPVTKNLEEELVNSEKHAIEQKLAKEAEEAKKEALEADKVEKAKQLAELTKAFKDAEKQYKDKVKESERIASRKIALEEEIYDLERKIAFEAEHYRLMEEALRMKDDEGEEGAPGGLPSTQSDYVEYIEKLLKEYADQFAKEYENLMKKANMREKARLLEQKERLRQENEAKEEELMQLREKLQKLGEEIVANEAQKSKLQKELHDLEEKRAHDHKEYLKAKAEKEIQIKKLEKENSELRADIDNTQRSSNEAIKVIIELEFEIKTYEKLLQKGDRDMSVIDASVPDLDSTLRRDDHIDVPLAEIQG